MAGHSKWANIKHKKAASDAKRGKIFGKLSKELTMAARTGDRDPDKNPRLRTAMNAARAANMPNDNIDRAIKKGTGELGGAALEEMSYEGYAPGGVAIMVFCLSDNKNRTASNVRATFGKNNGNLAANGAVNWMFNRKASFTVTGEHADEEKLMEVMLEEGADAERIDVGDDVAEIIGAPDAFGDIAKALEDAEIPVSESGVIMVPDNEVEVNDIATARQVMRLVETLEDDDDVEEVYHNMDVPDDIAAELSKE
jgi:YebC/PmpR family DNA-binding regulatory protein